MRLEGIQDSTKLFIASNMDAAEQSQLRAMLGFYSFDPSALLQRTREEKESTPGLTQLLAEAGTLHPGGDLCVFWFSLP